MLARDRDRDRDRDRLLQITTHTAVYTTSQPEAHATRAYDKLTATEESSHVMNVSVASSVIFVP